MSANNDIDILISSVNSKNSTLLREKYRKFGEELLNKMYNKLGWYPQENLLPVGQKMKVDDLAQDRLRKNILCLMGQLRTTNFTAEANKKFNDYINGESDLPIGLLECVFRSFSSFPLLKNQTTFDQLFKVSDHQKIGFNLIMNCFVKQYYRDFDLPEARHLFSIALGSTEKSKEIQKVLDFSLEVKTIAYSTKLFV